MNVLGIGGSVHDFSACVVQDGRVVSAIEEERLSRVKHHPLGRVSADQLNLKCIAYCLEAAGLHEGDIDATYSNDLILRSATRRRRTTLLNHHLTHAACAYFLSPYEAAAVLVVDGFGSIDGDDAETISYFTAEDRDVTLVERFTGRLARRDSSRPFSWGNFDYVENSLGAFYSFLTDRIGFESYEEGKTMALAAFGDRRYVDDIGLYLSCGSDGMVRFDGQSRHELGRFVDQQLARCDTEAARFQVRADIAHAGQVHLEEALLLHAHRIHAATGRNALCLSGGVFMNCVANYRLLKEGPFREVFVYGAAGDNGTGIGAALYGYYCEEASPRVPARPAAAMYTGRAYGPHEIRVALEARAHQVVFKLEEDICEAAASLLADEQILGWYQGRSEFGARALGNRSIIADPRHERIRDSINARVKGREWFRPFAPSVLHERQSEYFDVDDFLPYMTVNARIREQRAAELGAVTHVDGTGRIQSVTQHTNDRYHGLLSAFSRRTGVDVLLNTSFNENEPIVESPAEAIDCFLRTDIDALAIGDYLVRKKR
jgi:carbamoyltransferase